ncbi:MAG: hydrogenase maturation nickel metallochaperone HypA [Ignavibacteria bacterium]|jgi:hydrogenase nickel incorporation protein HypA/HybF
MHELSIAQDILDIVFTNVPPDDYEDVTKIKVKIGEISGVIPESLEFCFNAISAETQLSNAVLVIEKIPFILKCNSCDKTSTNEMGIRICPDCSGSDTTVISGTELEVTEVELKTHQEETA